MYVAITLGGYFLGPWNFLETDSAFSAYLFLCLFSVFLGVLTGNKKMPKKLNEKNEIGGFIFFKISLLFNILFALPTTYARTGNFFPDVIFGLTYPAEAYQRAIASVFPVVEYIRILIAPILMAAFPLGIVYWGRMSLCCKFIFLILVIHTVTIFISMGVNRGIFDVIFGGGFVYMIVKTREGKKIGTDFLKFLFLGIPLVILALTFFTYGQLTREGSGAPLGYFPAADRYSSLVPSDAPTVFLEYLYVLINQISIYLIQGYYGASLVFERGIDHLTFGVGNSDFLLRNFGNFFGNDFIESSAIYAVEIENNWLHGNYWFSIIPWIASDVGFPGVPIVLFVISFIYAKSVQIYWATGDWLSLLVAYLLFYLFLYFPANNYIVQSGEGMVAAFFILIFWLVRCVLCRNTFRKIIQKY